MQVTTRVYFKGIVKLVLSRSKLLPHLDNLYSDIQPMFIASVTAV